MKNMQVKVSMLKSHCPEADTHTHTGLTAPPGPLKWLVITLEFMPHKQCILHYRTCHCLPGSTVAKTRRPASAARSARRIFQVGLSGDV